MSLVVQKFGGTSVADPERIREVADHVARTRRRGDDVVVVVSAMGKETDALLHLASQVSRTRPGRELDMLITAGERKATALLCMALQPSFPVMNLLCFVWGLGAGITLTQGRTVLQIVAPPTHRARLLALFQLGLGGGGPIGAFIAGTLASVLGLQLAMVLPALAMVVLIAAVLTFLRVWTMRTVERPA